jgi:hypothetical protein
VQEILRPIGRVPCNKATKQIKKEREREFINVCKGMKELSLSLLPWLLVYWKTM